MKDKMKEEREKTVIKSRMPRVTKDEFSGDIILFPDEYNSFKSSCIRTEINVPEIPKMNADNK